MRNFLIAQKVSSYLNLRQNTNNNKMNPEQFFCASPCKTHTVRSTHRRKSFISWKYAKKALIVKSMLLLFGFWYHAVFVYDMHESTKQKVYCYTVISRLNELIENTIFTLFLLAREIVFIVAIGWCYNLISGRARAIIKFSGTNVLHQNETREKKISANVCYAGNG